MKKCFSVLFSLCASWCFAQAPSDFVIPVKVTVDTAGQPSITLSWPLNTDAISFTIKRKLISDISYKENFIAIATLVNGDGTIEQYKDSEIQKGLMYEYEVSGNYTTSLPAIKSTYICAGIDVPAVHNRGSILLLCDSSIATDIAANLQRLYADLVGDGWKVVRMDVNRSDNPHDAVWVKSKIQQVYAEQADLKQVLIIGHVPVPYSGNIFPDGHSNHIGAWPADGYYGAMNSNWTDVITSSPNPLYRPETRNLPGDGKFDEDSLPEVQLAIGRVDLSNLPVFSIYETDLLNRYLDKNHLFRHAQTIVQRRALIEDDLSSFTEKFSQSAWKSYAATVGYDNVQTGQYETWLLWPFGYLWSYGCGAGTFTGASGIGSSSDFVTQPYNTVFTQLFGSYFGDWDSQDNYMRSSLASPGNTLACVWGGRPHWYFHNMSAGMPIGYSTLLTMNNRGIYQNEGYGNANIQIALMGDPSIRSSYIKPPQAFFAQVNEQKIELLWSHADEANIAGYYLYRSNAVTGNFTLLNNEPITVLRFTDSTPLSGNNVYMVRTVKMDTIVTAGAFTNNSTYANLSQGLFDSAFISVVLPVNNIDFTATAGHCNAMLNWKVDGENGVKEYSIEYSTDGNIFKQAGVISTAGSASGQSKKYAYTHVATKGNNFYRIKIINRDGSFAYSKIIALAVDCLHNTVTVYPNPVTDILQVNALFEKGAAIALLYDAAGKTLVKQTLATGNNIIRMSALPGGLYNLSVTINGETQYFKIKK